MKKQEIDGWSVFLMIMGIVVVVFAVGTLVEKSINYFESKKEARHIADINAGIIEERIYMENQTKECHNETINDYYNFPNDFVDRECPFSRGACYDNNGNEMIGLSCKTPIAKKCLTIRGMNHSAIYILKYFSPLDKPDVSISLINSGDPSFYYEGAIGMDTNILKGTTIREVCE